MDCIDTEAAANTSRSVDVLQQYMCTVGRSGYMPAHSIFIYTLLYAINLTIMHMYIVYNIIYDVR